MKQSKPSRHGISLAMEYIRNIAELEASDEWNSYENEGDYKTIDEYQDMQGGLYLALQLLRGELKQTNNE